MKKHLPLLLALLTGTALHAQVEPTKVYVPVEGSEIEQRAGAERLRALMESDSRWQVVPNRQDADMVAEYRFSSAGIDNASLLLRDLKNNKDYRSRKVSAHYHGPENAGRSSAEELYSRCIKNGANNGDLRRWTVERQQLLDLHIGAGPGITNGEYNFASATLDAMAAFHLSSHVAVSAGLSYEKTFAKWDLSAITPQIGAIFMFPKKISSTPYLKLHVGIQCPLSKEDLAPNNGSGYHDEHALKGISASLAWGRRWQNNLWLEGSIGINTFNHKDYYDYASYVEHDNDDSLLSIGLKIGYAIPIIK